MSVRLKVLQFSYVNMQVITKVSFHLRLKFYGLICCRYLSFRCALLEPSALSQIRQFHVATAVWLVQVAVDPDLSETRESFAPCTQKEVKFPLPDSVAPALRYELSDIKHIQVDSKFYYNISETESRAKNKKVHINMDPENISFSSVDHFVLTKKKHLWK